MKVACFMLSFALAAYGLSIKDKDEICSSRNKSCIWLNEYLSKDYALPFHILLHTHSNPIIFCYEASLAVDTFIHFWDSLQVVVSTSEPENLVVHCGNSSHEIFSAPGHNASNTLSLPPFGVHCVGVKHSMKTNEDISFDLDAKLEFWPWYPVLLSIGLSLIYLAPTLSRNVGLIYGTGVTIGILASIIVLLYILSRYMPGRSFLGVGVLAGGYTVLGSLAYMLFDNVMDLCRQHVEYVLGYVVVTGLVSFAIIYWKGGVSNPRTFDLIQWSIQLVGLCVIYFSTPFTEASIAMMVSSLVIYSIPLRCNPLLLPFRLLWWLLSWLLGCILAPFSCIFICLRFLVPWRRRSPTLPKPRFLTIKEYEDQGLVETEKAITELRESCKKKKGMAKVITRLNNSSRFAEFLSGVDHVSPEERVNHEWEVIEDSDLEEDEERSYQHHTPPSSLLPPSQHSPSPPSPRVYPSSSSFSSNDESFSAMHYYTSPANVSGRSHDSRRRGDSFYSASPLKPSSRHKHY